MFDSVEPFGLATGVQRQLDSRDRRCGAAAPVGQAVQAPPRALRRPQPANARSGGAAKRGAATADQAAPAAVSLVGGEAPAAERSAATPGGPTRSVGRQRSWRGCGVQPQAAGRSAVAAKPTRSGAPARGSRASRGGPPRPAQQVAGARRARRRWPRGRRGVQPRQPWGSGPSRQPAGLPRAVPRGRRVVPAFKRGFNGALDRTTSAQIFESTSKRTPKERS